MIKIAHTLDAAILAVRKLQVTVRWVPTATVTDTLWPRMARRHARNTLAAHGCPPELQRELLQTLLWDARPGGDSFQGRFRLGPIKDIIIRTIEMARDLSVKFTPPSEAEADKYKVNPIPRLRQVPLLPDDEQTAQINQLRQLVRDWVYNEKILDGTEYADREEAVNNIEGILGIRGAGDVDAQRSLWKIILGGARNDDFAAGAMSQRQADAARKISGAIRDWLLAGQHEAGRESRGEPARWRADETGTDPLNSRDAATSVARQWQGPVYPAQVADWLQMVAHAWIAMVAHYLPLILSREIRRAAQRAGFGERKAA